jgi:hypothetical protein
VGVMTMFALLNVLLTRQRSICHNAALQAMARIWRDGQQKPCSIYRLLTTGARATVFSAPCHSVRETSRQLEPSMGAVLQAQLTRRSSSAS